MTHYRIRLHYKNGMSLGIIYLDHQLIDTSREIYVEPLKGQYIHVCISI